MRLFAALIATVLVAACSAGSTSSPASPIASAARTSPPAGASPTPTSPPSAPAGIPALGTILFARSDKEGAPATLYTVAPDGSARRQIVAPYDCCARWSFDGRQILMSGTARDGRATVRILPADGGPASDLQLPSGTLNLGPGAWLPDGRIAFEGWVDKDPSRMGVYLGVAPASAIGAVRLTTSPRGMHDFPLSASPDGHRLLFVRVRVDSSGNAADDGSLFSVALAGGTPSQLNAPGTSVGTQTSWGDPASWSPDSGRVAFVSYPTGQRQNAVLNVVQPDSGGLRQIAPAADPFSGSPWSQDGQWILTDREAVAGGAEVIAVHPDGTGLKVLTVSYACCATWSPDGSRILYLVGHNADTGDLYTANADGSSPLQLTHDPGRYEWYAWAPSTAP